MKAKVLGSLIVSVALSALTPSTWAAGQGGGGGGFHGGGGGGFHGGGFGGGFHGGGFAGGHTFGGARFGTPMTHMPVSGFRYQGYRASGVSGMHRVGTNIPNVRREEPYRNTPRVASAQARSNEISRQGRTFGPRGFTGRIAERHEGSWHHDWDHRHPHFAHGRFFVFDDGFWWGLDDGYYPWDYYPYYTYDYYPYDYVTDGSDEVPPQYQGDGEVAPAPDQTVQGVQAQLSQLGYYGGPIDGLFGPTTRDAVARYQEDKNLTVTGSLTSDTLQSFGLPQQASN